MKNAFNGLLNRVDTADERFCEIENILIKSSKTGKHDKD